MNTAPLTPQEVAAFRGMVLTRAPSLIDTLRGDERAIFSAAVVALMVSDNTIANGPAFIAGSTMTAATKAALFSLFDAARISPAKPDNTAMIVAVVAAVAVGAAVLILIVRR